MVMGFFIMAKDGVIEIIECCGFGSLESSYCSCFERGKSHFGTLKSQFYIYISCPFDDVHVFHKIKSCHNKILQILKKNWLTMKERKESMVVHNILAKLHWYRRCGKFSSLKGRLQSIIIVGLDLKPNKAQIKFNFWFVFF